MNFKRIWIFLLLIGCSSYGMEDGPRQSSERDARLTGSPRTPMGKTHGQLAAAVSPQRGFWRSVDSVESSPSSSAVPSPEKNTPTTSPLGKRTAEQAELSTGVTPVFATRRLLFDLSVADALKASSAQKAIVIINELPPAQIDRQVAELMRSLRKKPDLFEQENYDDVTLAVIQELNKKFIAQHGRPLNFLPLMRLEHLRTGDSAGGYHLESSEKPVTKIIANPQTEIYGGTFGRALRSKPPKYSSFFQRDKNFEKILADIQHSFVHPVLVTSQGRIGQAADGTYIEIRIAPWAIAARTVFPLIAYIPVGMPAGGTIILNQLNAEQENDLIPHTYTAAQLRELAARHGRSTELHTQDKEVMDIAAVLTGRPDARGVYVEMPVS